MAYDYQGSGLLLGHFEAGAAELLRGLVVEGVGAAAQQAGQQVALLPGETRGAAHAAQELADFRLEDDYQGYGSDVDYGVQQGGQEFHVEGHRYDAYHEEHQDGYEDVHGRRAPKPAEGYVEDQCHDYYVYYICKTQV